MRKLWPLALLVAGIAVAGPVTIYPGNRAEIINCSNSGSSAIALTKNRSYLMRVAGEDTYVCFAASGSTCASGGELFGAPFAMLIYITDDTDSVSCRSANSGGDLVFTQGDASLYPDIPVLEH